MHSGNVSADVRLLVLCRLDSEAMPMITLRLTAFDRRLLSQCKVKIEDGPYTKFRKDGWPYCPDCGLDGLISDCEPATIETIRLCIKCRWSPCWSTNRA